MEQTQEQTTRLYANALDMLALLKATLRVHGRRHALPASCDRGPDTECEIAMLARFLVDRVEG